MIFADPLYFLSSGSFTCQNGKMASTNEGDLVLDPFTGSSTTGLASYLFGRNFIGIDNNKTYLNLSMKEI